MLCSALMGAAAAACVAPMASAQSSWRPEKNVEFIIPTGPGGNNDRLTRLAQNIVQERKLIPVPSVVMNRPGGNQTLAVVYTHQHAGDPHYILFSNPAIFTNELNGLTPRRYTEFTPLALLVIESSVLAVRTESSIKSMRDLAERLKADPESVSFAMPARGGQPHLTAASAVRAAGADARKMKVVVFKGSGESIAAVMGGHVDVMVSSAGSVVPQLQSGQLRVLAVAAPQRIGGRFANAPTFREAGVNTSGIPAWRGFLGPRGLTAAQVDFWDDVFSRMTDTPEWKKQLEESDLAQQYLRSRDFAKYLDAEYASIRSVMTDLGLIK